MGRNAIPPNIIRTRGSSDTVAFFQIDLQHLKIITKLGVTRYSFCSAKMLQQTFALGGKLIAFPQTTAR